MTFHGITPPFEYFLPLKPFQLNLHDVFVHSKILLYVKRIKIDDFTMFPLNPRTHGPPLQKTRF